MKNSEFLDKIEQIIDERKSYDPEDSYIAELYDKGIEKISQKTGEEAVETIIAALKESDARFISESADLIFHLLVLLKFKNLSFADILNELQKRNKK
jgi:phosphoribosyl-ATP pyrophosphohydrolase